ncbi:hypothetical protein C0Z16_03245 [Paraburkholderia rhynchosiae]|uniref:Uncharacterized protein n=1 Tax=Paraburkholderia rhynchosiae TaxID=487049 RepID=A0ABX4VB26_9BURK|nr:hypothetical protein C0Z16_03245 [Paraburkholderia rhynchosiae]
MVSPYVRSVLRDVVSGLSSALAVGRAGGNFSAGRGLLVPKIGAVAGSFNTLKYLESIHTAYATSIQKLLPGVFQCCKGSIAIIHGNMLQ